MIVDCRFAHARMAHRQVRACADGRHLVFSHRSEDRFIAIASRVYNQMRAMSMNPH